MGILVVGSMGLDTVETPHGKVTDALGGAATYFSVSASYFTKVNLVAVVGNDFPKQHIDLLKKHKIDVDGLQQVEGKTFRWSGHYMKDLNEAQTLNTELNVFAGFDPQLPEKYTKAEYVFLANIDPVLQLKALKQVKKPKLIALDTMNFWIQGKLKELKATLRHIDILVINETEAKMLACEKNLMKAAQKIFGLGPKGLVIKRGEYGAMHVTKNSEFALPALPLEKVCDPTGAGDTFAGGFMGFIAKSNKVDDQTLKKAVVYGSVMASYNVEDFSLNKLKALNSGMINDRFNKFKKLTAF